MEGKRGTPHEPGVAFFRKLGRTVVRRRKVVIVVWIALFLGAVPLASRLNEVTSAGSGGFDAPNAESTKAQDVIDEQFPRVFPNSSAIVVLQGPDITDAGARDFALAFEASVVAPGAQANLSNFTSVYSVARELTAQTAMFVGPLVVSVNFTAFTVYGVPSMYVGNWMATNASLNTTQRDEAANASTVAALSALPIDGQLSQGVLAYYSVFYAGWAGSAGNATLVGDPPSRAMFAIPAAAGAYADLQTDPQHAGLVLYVLSSFNLTSWQDEAAIFAFANQQVAAFTGAPLPASFLRDAAALGPAPTNESARALASSIVNSTTLATFPLPLPTELTRSFVAPGNDTMLIIVAYDRAPAGFGSTMGDPVLADIIAIRANLSDLKATYPSVREALVTGNAAASLDASVAGEEDLARIEPATIGAVILLVSLFFLAAFIVIVPLGSIGAAFLLTQALVFLIGAFIVKVPADTLTFLFTILIGVGIDYAVFLMARYREERAEGKSRDEAVATSVTWAGESIATSGATVLIAFAILATGSFEMLRAMGFAVGVGVGVALLVSLTLIPAILALAGNRIFWPMSGDRFVKRQERVKAKAAAKGGNYFRRAAEFSVRRAKLVVLLAVIVSIPTTYISVTGQTSFDFIGGLPDTESVRGIHAMQDAFGAGQLGPTQVVVVFPNDIWDPQHGLSDSAAGALENMSATIAAMPNVQQVTSSTRPQGTALDARNISALSPAERAAVAGFVGLDNRTALVAVVLVEEPFTQDSMQTVREIRAAVHAMPSTDARLAGAEVYVGGQTAGTLDFAADMDQQFLWMRILVVLAIYIILLFVLGSYLLPLSAVLSVALSITWAYAATLLFFNEVIHLDVLFLVPLILFVLLMGIGMDYNIFILTRIREESQKGKDPKTAAVDAVERTGGIITALALVLAAALGSLMLASNSMLRGFGFAIAFAVILDAMVVRTYLVPAIMALLGPRAWWGPKWLRRVEPMVPAEAMPEPAQEAP